MRSPFLFPALLAVALLAPSEPRACEDHGSQRISVRNVVVQGDGCPTGSARAEIRSAMGDDVLEIIFSRFKSEKGPGVSISEGRKQCTVVLELVVPAGHRYTLANVRYEGVATIPAASRGSLSLEAFFPFNPGRPTLTRTLTGPHRGDFSGDSALRPEVFSPCGEVYPLNLKSDLRVQGPMGEAAVVTVNRIRGSLRVQRCP